MDYFKRAWAAVDENSPLEATENTRDNHKAFSRRIRFKIASIIFAVEFSSAI